MPEVLEELDSWIVGWVSFFCVFGYTSGFFARLGGVPVGKRVWDCAQEDRARIRWGDEMLTV